MKIIPILIGAVVMMACKDKQQPVVPGTINDTGLAVFDTVTRPYSGIDRVKDSLEAIHLIDSLYSIKPVAVFRSDSKRAAFERLIPAFIDTNAVVRTPIVFSDTVVYEYDKNGDKTGSRQICKSKQYIIEVFNSYDNYARGKIWINGRALREGIEVDTSLSGPDYGYAMVIDGEDACLMKFGTQAYLFLPGHIYNCNGMGCGVSYYLLYDLNTRKAILLEQFRSDFIAGYDKKSNSPVFISTDNWYSDFYQCFFYSGKVYRLDKASRIQPFTGENGKQVEFDGYSRDGVDSLVLTSAIFPVN